MHLCQPPFIPRVKENQSITKYFEDEKEILSDDSSSYASLRDRLDENPDLDDAQLRAALGVHYDRFCGERMAREKHELGLSDCTDEELQRIKEHFGVEYEAWRAERVVQVGEERAALGIDGNTLHDRAPKGKSGKDKKRPRDRLLRDREVGRKVMELRKRNAFFGYTYRRPKPVVLDCEAAEPRRGMRSRTPMWNLESRGPR